MLKRILGIVTAIAMCACLVVTAFADGIDLDDFDTTGVGAGNEEQPASNIVMSVAFEAFDGTTPSNVAGGVVWAVVKLSNYAEDIGDVSYSTDIETSAYDRVVSAVSAEIDLGTDAFSLYADEDGEIIWSTPYASMNKLGSVTAGLYDNVIHTLALTDDNSGFDHPLSKELLDEANGEVFRIALILNEDADYDICDLQVLEKDIYSVFSSNIVVLSKEADKKASTADFEDLKPTIANSTDYAVGSSTGTVTEFDSFDGWKTGDLMNCEIDSSGRLYVYSTNNSVNDQTAGDSALHSLSAPDSFVDGYAVYGEKLDLSNGFTFSFNARAAGATNMYNANMKYVYAKVGDYTFAMTGYTVAQVFYKDEYIFGMSATEGVYDISTYTYKTINDYEVFNRIKYVLGSTDYKESTTVSDYTYTHTTTDSYFEGLGLVQEGKLSNLSNITYTIKLVGDTLTFEKYVGETLVFSLSKDEIDTSTFDNAKVVLGGEHAFRNAGYFNNPKLEMSTDISYTQNGDTVYTGITVGTNEKGITYSAESADLGTATLVKLTTVEGDIDSDGSVKASDYTTFKAVMTTSEMPAMNAAQMMEADFNLDGTINMLDVRAFWLSFTKTARTSAYLR